MACPEEVRRTYARVSKPHAPQTLSISFGYHTDIKLTGSPYELKTPKERVVELDLVCDEEEGINIPSSTVYLSPIESVEGCGILSER